VGRRRSRSSPPRCRGHPGPPPRRMGPRNSREPRARQVVNAQHEARLPPTGNARSQSLPCLFGERLLPGCRSQDDAAALSQTPLRKGPEPGSNRRRRTTDTEPCRPSTPAPAAPAALGMGSRSSDPVPQVASRLGQPDPPTRPDRRSSPSPRPSKQSLTDSDPTTDASGHALT
jgi:hypothetical protein